MPKRPQQNRPRRTTVLIACEGSETEPNYFAGLCAEQAVRDHFAVTVLPGRGGNAETVTAAAILKRNEMKARGEAFDAVWCVMDVEGPTNKNTLTVARETARRERFEVALSNPSFEVWLIAHFEQTSRPFMDSDAAEAHLSRTHWQKHCGQHYDKADAELYARLRSLVDAAITNAERVLNQCIPRPECHNCNSSSEVYSLARRLRSGIS